MAYSLTGSAAQSNGNDHIINALIQMTDKGLSLPIIQIDQLDP